MWFCLGCSRDSVMRLLLFHSEICRVTHEYLCGFDWTSYTRMLCRTYLSMCPEIFIQFSFFLRQENIFNVMLKVAFIYIIRPLFYRDRCSKWLPLPYIAAWAPIFCLGRWLIGCLTIPEATRFQFFVAVTPWTEEVLSGFCTLTVLSLYRTWQSNGLKSREFGAHFLDFTNSTVALSHNVKHFVRVCVCNEQPNGINLLARSRLAMFYTTYMCFI
jgi:hypothetical protein